MPSPGRALTLQDLFSQLANNATENIPLDSTEVLNQLYADGEGLNFNVSGSPPTLTTSTIYPTNIAGEMPTSYWRLAEPSGGIAYDSHQAYFSIYPRIQSTSMTSITQNAASFLAHSGSASFTASSSSIVFPNGSSLQITGSLSIEFWINLSSFGTNGTGYSILTKQAGGSSGSTSEYEVYLHSNGTSGTLNFRQNNGFTTLNATSNLTSTSTWYHVVIVRDSGNNATTIYINGSAAGSTTFTAATTTTNNVTLGASGTFSTTTYLLEEVALYSKALTSTQVASHYAWGTAADATALAYNGTTTLYGSTPYPAYGSPTGSTYSGSSATWGTFTWK